MNLKEFCTRFETLSGRQLELPRFIEEGRRLLAEFTTPGGADTAWFRECLQQAIMGDDPAGRQRNGIWKNEITLYRRPGGSFSVLAYIWEAGVHDAIHDHGSWGIIGTLWGQFRERKYRRIDDGLDEAYAELFEISSDILGPGAVTSACLWTKESTGSRTRRVCLQYRSTFMEKAGAKAMSFFDPERKRTRRVYTPANYRKVIAVRALSSLYGSRAGNFWLRQPVMTGSLSLRQECGLALQEEEPKSGRRSAGEGDDG